MGLLSAADLCGWYGRASIYALPARYEPFGLSALEAALSGCALVLGDIASLHEVWGDAAIFLPSCDAAAWRDALACLAADAGARQELGRRARRRALEFTPQRMAAAYLSCYLATVRQKEGVCAS